MLSRWSTSRPGRSGPRSGGSSTGLILRSWNGASREAVAETDWLDRLLQDRNCHRPHRHHRHRRRRHRHRHQHQPRCLVHRLRRTLRLRRHVRPILPLHLHRLLHVPHRRASRKRRTAWHSSTKSNHRRFARSSTTTCLLSEGPERECPHCGTLSPLTPGVRLHLRTPQFPPASRECVPCLRSISTPRPAAHSRCMKAGRGRTPPAPILASGASASLSMTARVQSWTPGDPVPEVFTAIAVDPTGWEVVAHGIEFDRAIYEHILMARHGFPQLPLDIQHCSMSLALANAYPAELARLCFALEIEYQKDREGALLMRQMARPRKNRKGEKGIRWVFDAEKLARLIPYSAQDTRCCRAVWTHPRLVHLTPSERQLQIIDAVINRRGVHFNRRFVENARDLSMRERTALNNKLSESTDGAVSSVDQVQRLLAYISKHGHNLASVNRRSIAAALAANPDEATRKILELRRDGARASTRKFRCILAWANDDDRLRGTIRFYGSATGRWSARGPQLQNLKRNDLNVPLSAIDAVLAGHREALAKYGSPLEVIGSISKATLGAAPGHRLMKCDLSSIESRILAAFAGETWKLAAYREFDRTGDTRLEPYYVVARKMLRKNDPFAEITPAERQIGKGGDLAGGFSGSVGAWRRLVPKDEPSDGEIHADIRAWRQAHPKTVQFWRTLAAAARVAIRTGSEHKAGPITASYRNETLYLTLPSGRSIAYPQARLIPTKFEDAPPDILFKDNSRGAWTDRRAWFGTLVENVVQGAARDVLAAAIVRLELQAIPVVLSVHDEVVIEVPLNSPLTEEAFLALVLTPPDWAA